MQAKLELFDIVHALCPAAGLACGVDRGQKESNQDTDDGDHHQQFNEGKSARFAITQSPFQNVLTRFRCRSTGGHSPRARPTRIAMRPSEKYYTPSEAKSKESLPAGGRPSFRVLRSP